MREFEQFVLKSKPYIWMRDIKFNVSGSLQAKNNLVHRALEKQTLVRLTQGIYLVGPPYNQEKPDVFEIACLQYPISYVSMQSALAYWGWIPERTYTITSVTTNRTNTIKNSLGEFYYFKIPKQDFFYGVNYVYNSSKSSYLIARPWKAFADLINVSKKDYKTLEDVEADLRIERESMLENSLQDLRGLSELYAKRRVRSILKRLLKELVQCL